MCSRTLYVGADGVVITGRSMDWPEDMFSNAWVFPRGMTRHGAAGPDSITWTSVYGSLIVSAYEAGSADGMNETGLVGNGLYLAESNYGSLDGKPALNIMAYLQFVLDNYGSVAEAVDGMRAEPFRIIAPLLPNGKPATCHLSLSDPTGDSAIFEYLDSKLHIHHGPEYRVMTNSPSYDQQLAITAYWEEIGGMDFLPGTIRAADRYVRASFLTAAIPVGEDPRVISAVPGGSYGNQAVASMMGVMRAVSVPLGIADPDKPNLASTLWRTVWDHKNRVMFFDSATSPNTFWVPLADVDFAVGAPVMKLTMAGGRIHAGNAASDFEPAAPFAFLPAQPS